MTVVLGPNDDEAEEANDQLQDKIDAQESGATPDAVQSSDASLPD